MAFRHPDDWGGLNGTAVGPCPECVEDGLCAVCGESMVDAGAVQVCVRDGFTFDEAAEPDAYQMLYGGRS